MVYMLRIMFMQPLFHSGDYLGSAYPQDVRLRLNGPALLTAGRWAPLSGGESSEYPGDSVLIKGFLATIVPY